MATGERRSDECGCTGRFLVERQGYADKNDMKNFYSCLKEVYGPTSPGSSPLLSADGTKLISEKKKILERWAEHFDGVLTRSSSINDKAIERLSQVQVNESLDVTPTHGEAQMAIVNYPAAKQLYLIQFLYKSIRRVDQC